MNITTLASPGAKLNGADRLALFRIELAGLVLDAFNQKCVFRDKHTVIGLEHGKGTRIDALGEAGSIYHTPGTDLSASGNSIKHDAFEIMVDAKLISHLYLDEVEEAMNHFELRQRYANKLGTALAKAYDTNIARCAILAARRVARVPDGFGGTVLKSVLFNSDVEVLTKGLFDAQVIFDEKDVPEDQRYCVLRPRFYSMMAQNLNLINNLYGGTGSIAEGNVVKVAGFTLIKSNNVPNAVVTNSYKNKYDGDFSKSVAVCMTEEAVGTVQLKGLATETTWDHNRQATFVAAKFVVGHDVMRPECAVELRAEA